MTSIRSFEILKNPDHYTAREVSEINQKERSLRAANPNYKLFVEAQTANYSSENPQPPQHPIATLALYYIAKKELAQAEFDLRLQNSYFKNNVEELVKQQQRPNAKKTKAEQVLRMLGSRVNEKSLQGATRKLTEDRPILYPQAKKKEAEQAEKLRERAKSMSINFANKPA